MQNRPAPALQGLGFPDVTIPSPLSSKRYQLPIKLSDPSFKIRSATWSDLPAICAIYNYSLLHSEADDLFGPVSLEERGLMLSEQLYKGLPVLIAEMEGDVLGWAALTPYMSSEGSRFCS